MKVSYEQAQKFLSELLGDVELVDKGESVDETELHDSAKAYYKPDIEKEVKEILEPANQGKFINSFRTALQRDLNISKKETEGKTFDEIMGMVKTKHETATKDSASEFEKKYNDLLQTSSSDIEKLTAEWETKYNADVALANKKYEDHLTQEQMVKLVGQLPRKGGDITKQARVLRSEALANGYELKLNGNDLEIYKDGKKQKSDEVIKALAADIIPVATDTSHIKPSTVRPSARTIAQGDNISDIPDKRAAIRDWAEQAE